MKSVAILLAPGFEEIEFSAPLDILRRLQFNVVTVGIGGLNIEGTHGLVVVADTTLDSFTPHDFDAIILPGGPGAWILRDNATAIQHIIDMYHEHRLIAAICAAPIALARAGIVKGKDITAYPAQEILDALVEANITGKPVSVDGNIITGFGPGAAMAFGYAIGEYLGKDEDVATLKKAMMYY
ncbi:MAG: DJ-1/PfpI family protein [Akkermansia sp.]